MGLHKHAQYSFCYSFQFMSLGRCRVRLSGEAASGAVSYTQEEEEEGGPQKALGFALSV